MSKKKLLIVVDMQNDFVNGALGSPEAEAIVSNVSKKIETAKANGDFIIFTQDTHYDDYLETEEGKNLPIPHCIKNTTGWAISNKLNVPMEADVVEKNTFGAYNMGLSLSSFYEKKVDYIELVGLCTDICVLSNAVIAKAACPNSHVVVDAACCAGVTPESHDTALAAMRAIQVEILNQGQEPWRK
ncbi:cysteine hydrolase family protein [Selenomonas ruminantium]|uniref:nicotinamidase n=1 Tax=Selenomonas ruminantium TaxID=971 RepID=A0A1K1M0R8_SELRU|nr:isochorismatase family cysteine hydrolase [Selenomonas ruminantium]SFW15502.1 Nicotinamidase-related amidase [Selenomonas ruminantium]